jgi:hypothetical protein
MRCEQGQNEYKNLANKTFKTDWLKIADQPKIFRYVPLLFPLRPHLHPVARGRR